MSRRKETRCYNVNYDTIKDKVIEELMTHQKFMVVPDIRLGICDEMTVFHTKIKNHQYLDEMDDLPTLKYPEHKVIIVYFTGTPLAIVFGILWDYFLGDTTGMTIHKREHIKRLVFTKVALNGQVLGGNITYLQTYKRYLKYSAISKLIDKI